MTTARITILIAKNISIHCILVCIKFISFCGHDFNVQYLSDNVFCFFVLAGAPIQSPESLFFVLKAILKSEQREASTE